MSYHGHHSTNGDGETPVPPKTARRHRQGHETRERILGAALELAAERGYHGTTMALVTERSGVPASSVYWHFGNKDALLAEVLEYSYGRWRSEADYTIAAEGDLRAQFRARFDSIRLSLRDAPEFWRLGLMLALLTGPESIAARDRFLQVRHERIDTSLAWSESVLGADVVECHPELPALITQFVLAAGDGLFMASLIDRRWSFDRLVQALGRATGQAAAAWAERPRPAEGPRTPLPQPDPRPAPEDSRDRLLWAASRVAADHGYVGTTISRVCEESGLPVSSVYWYFEDKDALLAGAVEASWEGWIARQPQWEPVVGPADRDATLRTVLLQGVRSFFDAPDFMRIGHGVCLAQREEATAAQEIFLRVRRATEDSVSAWFLNTFVGSPVADDRTLALMAARIVIAVTDGLFVAEQVDDWDWDLDALIDFVVEVLEALIAARSTR